ncbi:hypothetical protein [Candidatus Corynebacterium faecigallinarum]|uniref:hypothetical protein n=1 Tax=Candidatus Corynebacterium faecigallinarum TaxID=2838528 RepID=UPI003FD56B7D
MRRDWNRGLAAMLVRWAKPAKSASPWRSAVIITAARELSGSMTQPMSPACRISSTRACASSVRPARRSSASCPAMRQVGQSSKGSSPPLARIRAWIASVSASVPLTSWSSRR